MSYEHLKAFPESDRERNKNRIYFLSKTLDDWYRELSEEDKNDALKRIIRRFVDTLYALSKEPLEVQEEKIGEMEINIQKLISGYKEIANRIYDVAPDSEIFGNTVYEINHNALGYLGMVRSKLNKDSEISEVEKLIEFCSDLQTALEYKIPLPKKANTQSTLMGVVRFLLTSEVSKDLILKEDQKKFENFLMEIN